jgi:PilZ domain
MNNPAGPITNEDPASVKRGAGRDSMFLKAVLRFPKSGFESEVRIRNLSAGGLMAEASARITRGEVAEIHLRNIGWISGHVAWVAEGRMGIAFEFPIDPKVVRSPVGNAQLDLPRHLQKLNETVHPGKIRRL